MDIFNKDYTTQEVADATGTTVKNMANWADRGLIKSKNKDDIGRGRTRTYSWFTLMQVACATAIMELGINSPKDAFEAAARFAHTGTGQSGWVGEAPQDKAVRWPGLPFHHMRGITMLYLSGQHSAVLLHRIWNKEAFSEGYFRLQDRLGGARGHIALNLTEIFQEVCRRLNTDYRVALDDAYRGEDGAVNWQRPGQGD
ncbi:MAG: hypothetical protein ACK5LJ_09800 [Paracoccus sp. (in: a-proteobacteria)]